MTNHKIKVGMEANKSINKANKESKTYLSVFDRNKLNDWNSQNKAMWSPEEWDEKIKSDKVYKSSLTSSTTTHTNYVRGKNDDTSQKKKKQVCVDQILSKKPSYSKFKSYK